MSRKTTQTQTIEVNYDEQAHVIMTAQDSRTAFRNALASAIDKGALILACKMAQAQAQAAQAQAQAQAQELLQAEQELFGVPVTVQGNHRNDSKGRQLTEALQNGATMNELKAIRGAVPQHFRYLREHGFTVTKADANGIIRAYIQS